jgi:hypothetical protein
MKKANKTGSSELAKRASTVKTSEKNTSLRDTAFFKKKMEKGAQILSMAKLPKFN